MNGKFAVAIGGIVWSIRNHGSFWVHLPVAVAVCATAAWMNVEAWRWAVVITAIALVLCAEMLNTAIEQLVRVLHPEHDPEVGRALDVAAGGVLVATIGAIALGIIALGPPLLSLL